MRIDISPYHRKNGDRCLDLRICLQCFCATAFQESFTNVFHPMLVPGKDVKITYYKGNYWK